MYFELGFKKNPYINTYLFSHTNFGMHLQKILPKNHNRLTYQIVHFHFGMYLQRFVRKKLPLYTYQISPFSDWYVYKAIFLSKPLSKYIPFCYFTVWYVLATFF